MLFNSYEFIFLFLPAALAVFYIAKKVHGLRLAIGCLVLASLFFYAWWDPRYLLLIFGSIVFNYSAGLLLSREGAAKHTGHGRTLLGVGVAGNLLALGYFKYANFFVDTVNALAGTDVHLQKIVLPLAISFFTFQQIAYLVDAYRGETREHDFLQYCLFVSFFPQLIAGPIVHHKEMLPQFTAGRLVHPIQENISIGLTIFVIGLMKKVVIADGVAAYSTPVFDSAVQGAPLTFFDAWGGALAYTFQLYFDFSGYSDMAIGLARMFGIRLPLNFHSPYKATSIIDFWRRWHMTLSRFLRDYLYFGLGGNRKGPTRRYINLLVTMLLGGLWHGAGWTFVIWGGLHGFYLVVNHVWRKFWRWLRPGRTTDTPLGRAVARLVTFFCVVVGWVLFRAESLDAATHMLASMAGLNGISLPAGLAPRLGGLEAPLAELGVSFTGMFQHDVFAHSMTGLFWLAALFVVIWACPNTQQIMGRYRPAFDIYRHENGRRRPWQWRAAPRWAFLTAAMAIVCTLFLSRLSEFLYFQF